MYNLALNIPTLTDATSWYRAAGPFAAIRRRCKYLTGLSISTWNWASIGFCDAVFMQRPFLNEHRIVLDESKFMKKKIWLDYDDYLLGVPTDNPTHAKYMAPEIQENIKYLLTHADVVTVSTEHLKKLYSEFNKNIVVVPNAIDTKVFDRDKPKPRRKIITWRGSPTHHRDVFTHSPAIVEASRDQKNKDWQWHFIGDRVWFLTDSMPHYQTFVTKPMSIMEYHMHLLNLCPSAMMVPLANSDFNECKSNIAWIEASYAGAVTIAPKWKEWERPGVLTYRSPEEFSQALYAITTGKIDIESTAKNSWEYIKENLSLDRVNELRIDILCDLLECEKTDLGYV